MMLDFYAYSPAQSGLMHVKPIIHFVVEGNKVQIFDAQTSQIYTVTGLSIRLKAFFLFDIAPFSHTAKIAKE